MSFVSKMLSRKLTYFSILLIFSFGEFFAEEIHSLTFKATVTGNSGSTECEFSLFFTDEEILKNSKVKCGKIRRPMTIDSFTYESSMHILRKAFENCRVFICCRILTFFLKFLILQ